MFNSPLAARHHENYREDCMDASLLKDLIGKGQPVRIETASGQAFEVRHRDSLAFSPKKTSLVILFEENGEEHFALIPLLTITAAVVKA